MPPTSDSAAPCRPTPAPASDASERRLRRLADLSNEVYLTLQYHDHGQHQVTWASAATAPLLGLSPELLTAAPESLLLYVHPEDRAALAASLTTGTDTIAYRWRTAGRADRGWTWLQLTYVPDEHAPGRVDAQIRSTETTHQAKRQLANAVEHETATLARLEEVEGLRDHILRSLSHRVRTPLAILKACAQTALDPPSPLDGQTHNVLFEQIGRASQTLESLLNDLLDLPTDRVIELDDESAISFERLLADVASTTLGPDHQMVAQIEEGLMVQEGTSVLRRSLVHLLRNVERHTPAGTRVMVKADRPTNGALTVTVTDNGPGLPERMRGHLFEPFVTADQGPDPTLGIGLSVVEHLVTDRGGEVIVRSEPGQGVRVTLLLPRV